MKIAKTGVNKFLIDITDQELSVLCEFHHHALKWQKELLKSWKISPVGSRQLTVIESLCNQLKSVL